MKFIPDHRTIFECTDDDKVEVPAILNSTIEFREGMEFTLVRPNWDGTPPEEIIFMVTGVKLRLFDYVDGELSTTVFLKKKV